ncbi:tRNA (adenosine(37)-N6)-threonylcarbamoyltransferase complex dimerization subunit type 1 TsaB [Erythrobacter sp. F6033]|uniref:tRNA (adenosine(37)-N6)-threonylcarbamoyltransferase complex dimerization subunit type 1 TsaB n=1 Tax=Erythrobacter sp. F6033 TaxID=2926401 RepID=UPI001FF40AE9|nr:tRNA (adenosine(37)-N6)-threonylcarbamoyltransferase complex dimerization subunit type 1 TsaB [Erythrobacter sp. F6033]MCK0127941.1 tRNA (adenosine(37)-N6)-threonylcarbamoyltransferase complex dimerization subunit type 1 TsaB [Erythrobacter sp. F6033]
MRILAIETATEACSVALFEDDQLIARDHRVLGRGHAERLVPMIADLPDKGRADQILVSLGPGSFTGVRIGIATARALGFAWNAQVFGYPTLALIAAQARQISERSVTVCMNGGHGEWFVADFDGSTNDGAFQSLTPDAAVQRGALDQIAGNRAADFANRLADGRSAIDILPDASAVGLLHNGQLTAVLNPIYGRAPDAKPQSMATPK